jgi:hypothetical protein
MQIINIYDLCNISLVARKIFSLSARYCGVSEESGTPRHFPVARLKISDRVF